MHSKDQKILKLVESDDAETVKLGLQAAITVINTETVVFWAIRFESLFYKLDNKNYESDIKDMLDNIANHISALLNEPKLMLNNFTLNLKSLYNFLINNKVTSESRLAFVKLHGDHLHMALLHARIETLIDDGKNEKLSTKFNKDL